MGLLTSNLIPLNGIGKLPYFEEYVDKSFDLIEIIKIYLIEDMINCSSYARITSLYNSSCQCYQNWLIG